MDGGLALGVDGDVPQTEIDTFQFYVDGKRIDVPNKLFADCFEPNFKKEHFAIKIGDDGLSALVFMGGGDGAGGYQVIWALHKDGHHSRFSKPCSDYDYTGLLNIFVDQFSN